MAPKNSLVCFWCSIEYKFFAITRGNAFYKNILVTLANASVTIVEKPFKTLSLVQIDCLIH